MLIGVRGILNFVKVPAGLEILLFWFHMQGSYRFILPKAVVYTVGVLVACVMTGEVIVPCVEVYVH